MNNTTLTIGFVFFLVLIMSSTYAHAVEEEYVQQTLQESLFPLCAKELEGYKLAVLEHLAAGVYYPIWYKETEVPGIYLDIEGSYFTAQDLNIKVMCNVPVLRLIDVARTTDV